ncbi:MAG: hypothetical protein QOJ92_2035 [Frankiales bacterium]|nr:hypothetical protein [Frankiales bacterium]
MNILGLQVSIESATSRQRWTRRVVALGVANAAILGGGLAYAAWNTTGTGTGSASSGSSAALTLAAGTVNTNVLYPNGSGDVVVVITNSNPFNVNVSNLTLPATAATAYTNAGLTTLNAACNTGGTGVAWAYASKSLSGVVVAKKVGGTDGTLTLTLTGGAAMTNLSDNSCQSSFFKMPDVSTVTAASSANASVAAITQ